MVVAAAPSPTPTAPPRTARSMASVRNWMRMCPLVAPRARRSPISERRSRTPISMTLPTPMAPTRRETAPRPRNRVFRVGGGGEVGVDVVDLVGGGLQVDLRGVAVEAEVRLRGGVSDKRGGVDL